MTRRLRVNKVSVLALQVASWEHARGRARFKPSYLCIRESIMEVMGKSDGEKEVRGKRQFINIGSVGCMIGAWKDKQN